MTTAVIFVCDLKVDLINQEEVNLMKKYLLIIFASLFLVTSLVNADDFAPTEIKGARTIGTNEASMLWDKGLQFIDVRSLKDFETGHLPGAHHLAVHSEDFTAENLRSIVAADEAVVFYCNGIACMGSSVASQKAVEWGWANVIYYREGFRQWQADGLPVE